MSAIKVITIPNGRQVTLREYVKTWKLLLTLPPAQPVTGWSWYSEMAGDVLRDISAGVQDRINQRGGLKIAPEIRANRLHRLCVDHVKCECRWCGQPLAAYAPKHIRFCSTDCRRSHG